MLSSDLRPASTPCSTIACNVAAMASGYASSGGMRTRVDASAAGSIAANLRALVHHDRAELHLSLRSTRCIEAGAVAARAIDGSPLVSRYLVRWTPEGGRDRHAQRDRQAA